MARGAGPCAKCLEERLAEIAGPILARDAVNALENVQDVWEKIRVKTKAEK